MLVNLKSGDVKEPPSLRRRRRSRLRRAVLDSVGSRTQVWRPSWGLHFSSSGTLSCVQSDVGTSSPAGSGINTARKLVLAWVVLTPPSVFDTDRAPDRGLPTAVGIGSRVWPPQGLSPRRTWTPAVAVMRIPPRTKNSSAPQQRGCMERRVSFSESFEPLRWKRGREAAGWILQNGFACPFLEDCPSSPLNPPR
jgi:hypothetical protein